MVKVNEQCMMLGSQWGLLLGETYRAQQAAQGRYLAKTRIVLEDLRDRVRDIPQVADADRAAITESIDSALHGPNSELDGETAALLGEVNGRMVRAIIECQFPD